jgi:hypothetical protein
MSVRLSLWIYSPLDLGRFFSFLILYTVSRLLGWGISPSQGRYVHAEQHKTQNKRTQTSMPRVGFELTTPVFERAKTVHALERAATAIGSMCDPHNLNHNIHHSAVFFYDLPCGLFERSFHIRILCKSHKSPVRFPVMKLTDMTSPLCVFKHFVQSAHGKALWLRVTTRKNICPNLNSLLEFKLNLDVTWLRFVERAKFSAVYI